MPCDVPSSSEDSSTTGGMCYLSGCDRKPTGKREGPGKSAYTTIPKYISEYYAGNRSDGGFDANDVDWSEF